MRTPGAAGLLLSLAVAAIPLSAQQRGERSAAPQRGWIGVSVEIPPNGGQEGLPMSATITGVLKGSPAQKAGLRPGDQLVSVNGVGLENDFGLLSQTLRPGDTVRIVVERNGRRREFRLRAVTLPPDIAPPTPTLTLTWSVRPDSVVDLMFRAMDSIRDELGSIVKGSVQVLSVPDVRDSILAVSRRGAGGIPVSTADQDSGTFPMVTIFQPSTDSSAIIFPGVDLSFRVYSAPQGVPDSVLQAMRDLDRRVETAQALSQAQLDEAQAEAAQVADFMPLTPYRLGQNWVAGAEMVDLRPGLANYFRVASGVLVVTVPEGTPAAMAGLEPGDVIVKVGSTPVSSIEDLRSGLSEPGDTLRLQVIRKGRTVQALLGR